MTSNLLTPRVLINDAAVDELPDTPSREPLAFHQRLAGYAPSRLVDAPEAARALGIGRLLVKDESSRLGLPAFKILGASWATFRALEERVGGFADWQTLDDLAAQIAPRRPLTLVAATDGNHGRAVARMAQLLGLSSRIYVPDDMVQARRDAIASEGAAVARKNGLTDADCLAVADRPIARPPPLVHPGEHGDLAIDVVDDARLELARVRPVKAPRVLDERPAPGNREGEEERVDLVRLEQRADVGRRPEDAEAAVLGVLPLRVVVGEADRLDPGRGVVEELVRHGAPRLAGADDERPPDPDAGAPDFLEVTPDREAPERDEEDVEPEEEDEERPRQREGAGEREEADED